jgi:predicted phosphodiesterase
MTILPVSDLHIDFSENYLFCRQALNVSVDVLVIAGDLCQFNYKKRDKFIRQILLPRFPRIICIPGNHEFYGSDVGDERLQYMHAIMIDNDTGHVCYMLNNATLDIGDVRFICTCLWSPVLRVPATIMRKMADYTEIAGYTINANNALNERSRLFLTHELEALPHDKRAVIITHHMPLWNLIDDEMKHATTNEAYANNLELLIRVHDNVIAAWIYGHAHRHRFDEIYDIPFVRNPLGYLFCEDNTLELDKILNIQ